MFYVSDKLSYEQMNISDERVENIWITLKVNKKIHVVGNIYRPPRSDSNYFDALLDVIEQATSSYDNVIVMGDLNYDYRRDSSLSPKSCEFD